MAGRPDAEDLILQLCDKHPEGVSQALIQEHGPHLPLEEIGLAINNLTNAHRLQMFKQEDGLTPIFKAVDVADAIKLKGLSAEDALVFQEIAKSGNLGLWTKEMKNKTNLTPNQITKVLRNLESRKLVKAVKSVASANRKVYMSYEIEPAREITGGAWYTDHELDAEFIEALRKASLQYIKKHREASGSQIAKFLGSKGLVNDVKLGPDEYETILGSLVLDGQLTKWDGEHEEMYALGNHPMMDTTALTSMPCGICPVAADCTPDGAISPYTCDYYQKWLAF